LAAGQGYGKINSVFNAEKAISVPEINKKTQKNKAGLPQIIIFAAMLFASLVFSVIIPMAIARADNGLSICSAQSNASTDIGTCVNRIYVISLAAGGFIAVLLIIVAGYLYMTGGEGVKTAKNIIYSVISGLVILFGGFALLNTINPDLTTFGSLSLPNLTCNGAAGSSDAGKNLCAAPSANLITNGPSTTGPAAAGPSTGTFVIDGYNLSAYSTNPNFAATVTSVLNTTQQANLTTAQAITNYMAAKVQNGPQPPLGPMQLTGDMVLTSAHNYGIDPNMLLTLMWVESAFGTSSSKDIQTHNPGSVGNNDTGQTVNDNTWQDGVDALSQWLSNNEAN
jgi:hypothetical protein